MYESFATPTPPATMTAPVVDDVDAVVFVPVITPLVFTAVSVPTEVIAGCAAVVTVPAVVAVAALPVMLPEIGFVTFKLISVPTDVKLDATTLFASVAPVNVPAAATTVPIIEPSTVRSPSTSTLLKVGLRPNIPPLFLIMDLLLH